MAKKYSPVRTTEANLDELLEEHGLEIGPDEYVRWQVRSPHHPRNWHWRRKCYDVGLIMFLEMFMSAMSMVGTAVSDQARSEYGVGKTLGYFAFNSVYLLGEGVGGIFLPPISETFGRKSMYTAATVLNWVFCILVAAVPGSVNGSLALVIIGRFVTGTASSIPATVAPGSLEDIYSPAHRIWGVFAWTTASNVGLLLGPIYSSYVTYYLGWRWVFWSSSIIMGIASIFTLFLHESRPTLLLQRKLTLLLEQSNEATTLRICNPDAVLPLRAFLRETLLRPVHLLLTEPIILLCSALNAVSFAMIYGLTEVLPVVYSLFDFSAEASSLAFLPLLAGLFFCLPARMLDQRRLAALARAGTPVMPEDKIQSFAVAVPALALGLWAFAWTIPPRVDGVHWMVSMAALVPVGFATNDLDTVLCGYMADSYSMYAASAFSALALLRAILATVFPLFTGSMFEALGPNVAASVLAAVATVFCVSPVVLLKYGRRLREASAFASFSTKMSEASFGSEDTLVGEKRGCD